VNEQSKQLEIVFVSSDKNQEDQLKHFVDKQGPWLMIPFEDPIRDELKRKVELYMYRFLINLFNEQYIYSMESVLPVNNKALV